MSLPTWRANVGYEEGEPWVVKKMVTGYPRFFIHNSIKAFAAAIADRFAKPGQTAVLFSSKAAATRCLAFIKQYAATLDSANVLPDLAAVHLVLDPSNPATGPVRSLVPTISAVLMHPDAFPLAKQYWQHTGDGVSSRRAEFSHKLFTDGLLVEESAAEKAAAAAAAPKLSASPSPTTAIPGMKQFRGPKRYQRPMSPTSTAPISSISTTAAAAPINGRPASPTLADEDDDETNRFLEERYGRNLDISFVRRARAAIMRRITGALTSKNHVEKESPSPSPVEKSDKDAEPLRGVAVREDDVYLLPCGMNAIYNAHRFLLTARPDRAHLKSINFGFPYVDTLKILQKFGAGCLFYGHASEDDLDDLEKRLAGGERFLGLFCEFPGNPLLTCPNLVRIRTLADQYDFAVVVDETIGTFANVNVLPYADVVVSSLTKIFSGDCNVMGGSLVLNRRLPLYDILKSAATSEYDPDGYWAEDAIFMERNSRDFAARVERINQNAEVLCDVLRASPIVRELHYPKYCPTNANYEACKIAPSSGYGGLLSCSFKTKQQAITFFDEVESAKGPSLGTNFTLTSPYVVLAHYMELDWCRSLGVDPDLIRVSVGLEDTDDLRRRFEVALAAAAAAPEA